MNVPEYETIQVQSAGQHVLLATLNRPDVLNAINTRLGGELFDLYSRVTAEPAAVRCIVLTGAGKAFCAGGDLKERDGMTRQQWQAQHELFERVFVAMLECPVPTIAAVNGAAFGGGMEIALCCDFIYAASSARFAFPEAKLGILPGGCGTQNFSRAVGERRSKELILSGRAFSADEAQAWGAVNKVCPGDILLEEARATAHTIAGNAPISVRQAKKSIHYGLQMDLLTGYRFEIEAYNRLVDTEDRREGVRAFNDKRKPVFQDR